MEKFSSRHGLQPPEPEIKIRQDAPYDLRGIVVDIAYESELNPHSMRDLVCRTIRVREDPNNWSAFPNIDHEVRQHLDNCHWYQVYDIIEATYNHLQNMDQYTTIRRGGKSPAKRFEEEINKYFRTSGIGWQLVKGQVLVRGEEDFNQTITAAHTVLTKQRRLTAANEIRQALQDLSGRPEPDITGALQHGIAALECVMRDACGDPKATLGALLTRHKGNISSPLDQAIEKIWGFASEQGRHLREGRNPKIEEAELTVHVAAAVATYLSKKHNI